MRLIDADALMPKLKAILEAENQIYGRASWDFSARCVQAVENAPTIESEIIRCKDCKHRDKYGCCKYWKGLAMADIPIATDDNDFCSYAEQKGEQCERKL